MKDADPSHLKFGQLHRQTSIMMFRDHGVRRKGNIRWSRPLQAITCVLFAATVQGCSAVQERYIEQHPIKNLTVVFLDEASLHDRWKQISGVDAVRLQPQMNTNTPLVQTVKGFYDFSSNTLYCPKWNFEVCGHELHHAALGQFHPAH